MDKQTISAFENRVKNYLKLRNQVKAKLPKLSKSSTPEQLESYRKSFEESLRAARVGAKRGDVFNTEGSDYIRRTLKSEFKGKDRAQLLSLSRADRAGGNAGDSFIEPAATAKGDKVSFRRPPPVAGG